MLAATIVPALYNDHSVASLVDANHHYTCSGGPRSGWHWWAGDVYWHLRGGPGAPTLPPGFNPDSLIDTGLALGAWVLLATAAAGRLLRRGVARWPGSLDRAARVGLALSATLLALSAWRAATRPQPVDYVRSLPSIGAVPVLGDVRSIPDARPAEGWREENDGRTPWVVPVEGESWGHYPRALDVDRRVGPIWLRQSCMPAHGDSSFRFAQRCQLLWRSEGEARWSPATRHGEYGVGVADLRLDARHRIVFLSDHTGTRAALGLERLRERRSDDPRVDWRASLPFGFAQMQHFSDAVAPRWPAVALALGGLLLALATRARDRSPTSPDPEVRGYRDDARAPLPDAERVAGWLRDEATECPLRTLAVLALTHGPLAVSLLAP